ncbi:PACE efflux transporter [Stenotrophomonas rhizophila]|uniref:PACE efflux transporter n=1 Tax=Stenotrophomonas rhizophila TaxID=216778 RepID=UPI003517236F
MLFEGIALCRCAPVMSYVLGKSLFDTGVLTIALTTCAMLWNMLYNALFERVEKQSWLNRTEPERIGYAVGFEGGLVLVLVVVLVVVLAA